MYIFRDPLGSAKGIFYFRKFLILFIVLFWLQGYSQAKLQITEAKKDFGSVKRGTVLKNEYEITNVGNAPLLINDVVVACSCTSVDFSGKPVLPGQKTIILVTFNTASTYGRQDRFVTVISNDPKSPHKLRYKANVSKE